MTSARRGRGGRPSRTRPAHGGRRAGAGRRPRHAGPAGGRPAAEPVATWLDAAIAGMDWSPVDQRLGRLGAALVGRARRRLRRRLAGRLLDRGRRPPPRRRRPRARRPRDVRSSPPAGSRTPGTAVQPVLDELPGCSAPTRFPGARSCPGHTAGRSPPRCTRTREPFGLHPALVGVCGDGWGQRATGRAGVPVRALRASREALGWSGRPEIPSVGARTARADQLAPARVAGGLQEVGDPRCPRSCSSAPSGATRARARRPTRSVPASTTS